MSEQLKPLLVSVKGARHLLGDIGHNQIWQIIGTGKLDVVGSKYKRFITVASIESYIASMPRRQPTAAPDDGAGA